MNHKKYSNFVRPTLSAEKVSSQITGEEARKLYLEEINNICQGSDHKYTILRSIDITKPKKRIEECETSNLKLFTSAQNNNIDSLKYILDTCPDKINSVDNFGWSLLMIACQANSIEVVKELLKRGIDTTIRDKSGNSAQNLIIRNKNVLLADIYLNHIKCYKQIDISLDKPKHIENFKCEICDCQSFNDREEHLSSTLHNINASKGKKVPTNYVLPASNKGYQIMLKVGWDKEVGLGPDGAGKKYPIKAEQKYDKKGLGFGRIKKDKSFPNQIAVLTKPLNKKHIESDQQRSKRMEINFRRQFY